MFRPFRTRPRAFATAPTFPLKHQHTLPASSSPVCPKLHFFNSVTQESGKIPTYRVLDGVGIPIEQAELPDVCLSLSTSALLIHPCRSPQTLLASCALPLLPVARLSILTLAVSRYENMQLLPTMDNILYNVQRQGKVSFYVRHPHPLISPLGSNQSP